MAPEMLEFDRDFLARPCDVWAAGLILYELLTGKQAFQNKNDSSVVTKILQAAFEPIPMEYS
jgi:serine/threonine protein kinase